MQGVLGVEINLTGETGRTADARDHNDYNSAHPYFIDGLQQAIEHHSVATAGAPQVREKPLSQIIFNCHWSNPLSLDQSQNIQNILRGDKNAVNSVGEKHLLRIIRRHFHRT